MLRLLSSVADLRKHKFISYPKATRQDKRRLRRGQYIVEHVSPVYVHPDNDDKSMTVWYSGYEEGEEVNLEQYLHEELFEQGSVMTWTTLWNKTLSERDSFSFEMYSLQKNILLEFVKIPVELLFLSSPPSLP